MKLAQFLASAMPTTSKISLHVTTLASTSVSAPTMGPGVPQIVESLPQLFVQSSTVEPYEVAPTQVTTSSTPPAGNMTNTYSSNDMVDEQQGGIKTITLSSSKQGREESSSEEDHGIPLKQPSPSRRQTHMNRKSSIRVDGASKTCARNDEKDTTKQPTATVGGENKEGIVNTETPASDSTSTSLLSSPPRELLSRASTSISKLTDNRPFFVLKNDGKEIKRIQWNIIPLHQRGNKITLEDDKHSIDDDDDDDTYENNNQKDKMTSSPSPPKRGRGRPRKQNRAKRKPTTGRRHGDDPSGEYSPPSSPSSSGGSNHKGRRDRPQRRAKVRAKAKTKKQAAREAASSSTSSSRSPSPQHTLLHANNRDMNKKRRSSSSPNIQLHRASVVDDQGDESDNYNKNGNNGTMQVLQSG
jgi:hypothetical protein